MTTSFTSALDVVNPAITEALHGLLGPDVRLELLSTRLDPSYGIHVKIRWRLRGFLVQRIFLLGSCSSSYDGSFMLKVLGILQSSIERENAELAGVA